MVIALVGRRIDPPDAPVSIFPDHAIELVRERIHDLLERQQATALLCSAACGADLIALGAAGALGIRRRIVLPFEAARFRETSVADRPGDWGPLFDRIIAEVKAKGDLVVLDLKPESDESYTQANRAIVDEASRLAQSSGEPVSAVLVWNGVSRGNGDVTSAYGDAARSRGWRVLEISTLP